MWRAYSWYDLAELGLVEPRSSNSLVSFSDIVNYLLCLTLH